MGAGNTMFYLEAGKIVAYQEGEERVFYCGALKLTVKPGALTETTTTRPVAIVTVEDLVSVTWATVCDFFPDTFPASRSRRELWSCLVRPFLADVYKSYAIGALDAEMLDAVMAPWELTWDV